MSRAPAGSGPMSRRGRLLTMSSKSEISTTLKVDGHDTPSTPGASVRKGSKRPFSWRVPPKRSLFCSLFQGGPGGSGWLGSSRGGRKGTQNPPVPARKVAKKGREKAKRVREKGPKRRKEVRKGSRKAPRILLCRARKGPKKAKRARKVRREQWGNGEKAHEKRKAKRRKRPSASLEK